MLVAWTPKTWAADDRVDLAQVTSPWIYHAAASTLALMRADNLRFSKSGFSLIGQVYGPLYGLCKSEKYFDETAAAFCSGFLVAPDLVVTAGHCLRDDRDCAATSLVFGFSSGHGSTFFPLNADQIYSCSEILHSETGEQSSDFAVIRLDRPAKGITPLRLQSSLDLRVQDPVVVIGHPGGLSTKVAQGQVTSADDDTKFETDLMTYGGNSGSAVFDAKSGRVEGVFVRGEEDFVQQGDCRVSASRHGGEEVTRIDVVLPYLGF